MIYPISFFRKALATTLTPSRMAPLSDAARIEKKTAAGMKKKDKRLRHDEENGPSTCESIVWPSVQVSKNIEPIK
jgi:hypothetical protein